MGAMFLNTWENEAVKNFDEALFNYLMEFDGIYDEIVILCIGTDRATGDCLGPLTGYKLVGELATFNGITLYGTLDEPVHAKNIAEVVKEIYEQHKKPLVIAVDASLGTTDHIGYLYFGHGPVAPGAGLDKAINEVGDIFVTGIVNAYGVMEHFTLQNTRLNVVMRMADVICSGMLNCLKKFNQEQKCREVRLDLMNIS